MPPTLPKSLTFGQWLKQRRKALGWTQEALAQRVACATVTLKKLEAQTLQPSQQLAQLLAQALGVPPTEHAAFIEFARTARSPHPAPFQLSPHQLPLAPAQRPVRLPAPLTPLIGREPEVTTAVSWLRRPSLRLLTLVGPPGTGKTRLGIEVAIALNQDFADGIIFVELAPVSEAAQVVAAIALALALRETPGQSWQTTLHAYLQAKQLLLVLDNFEQVVAAGPLLTQLLKAAPQVKALVTSREALAVYGEQELPVAPLALPKLQPLPAVPELLRYPAIALFVQRAQAVQPTFSLTAENAPAVAQVCACLDGLPLAIEMAAARVKRLSPASLLAQLQHRLAVLATGLRDLSPRQQTLRGALDWSYHLLPHTEQLALAQLAVFVGGATPAAAQAVLGYPLPPGEAFGAVVESLVNKSLAQNTAGPDPTPEAPRVALLETIREYALEKLEASGEAAATRQRHATYYLALAQTAEEALSTAQQTLWLNRLETENNNLRAALRWCLQQQLSQGLQLAIALQPFWIMHGHVSEGWTWFEAFLNQLAPQTLPVALRAQALSAAGALLDAVGNGQQADPLAEAGLTLYRELADAAGTAKAALTLAGVRLTHNHYAGALPLLHEALELYRSLQDTLGMANALNHLGQAAKEQGHYAQAQTYFEESLALNRQLGNLRGITSTINQLSIVAYWRGDYAQVIQWAQESLQTAQAMGNLTGMALALDCLGMAAYKQNNLERALAWLAESLALYQKIGNKSGQAIVFTDMGIVAQAQGHAVEAVRLHRESFLLAQEIGDKRRMAFCLEGLGTALAPTQPTLAVRCLSKAHNLRLQLQAPLPPTEQADYAQALSAAQHRLAPADFALAWEQGQNEALEALRATLQALPT